MNKALNEKFKSRLDKIEAELNSILPQEFPAELTGKAFDKLPSSIEAKHIRPLSLPCRDLMLRGGKRWRTLLLVLSCGLAGGNEDDAYPLTPLVELCHTASLIHDDLEDNSEERRGGAAVHIKYGTDSAINSGSWLYFHGTTLIEAYSQEPKIKCALYKSYMTNMRRLHLGQAIDITWHREALLLPSFEEYAAMIALKTGSLARLAGELGFIAAKCEAGASAYGNTMTDFGIAFQILDDVKNITSGNGGKMRGDDIVEGKKSLPVIFHLKHYPDDAEKFAGFFKEAKTNGIKSPAVENCINLMEKSGAIKEAENYAFTLLRNALDKLHQTYAGNYAEQLITELFSIILNKQNI